MITFTNIYRGSQPVIFALVSTYYRLFRFKTDAVFPTFKSAYVNGVIGLPQTLRAESFELLLQLVKLNVHPSISIARVLVVADG